MTLYHFTANRFLKSIIRDGLTRGMMLKTIKPLCMIANKQWLTTNPSFEQGWAVGTGILPYKRNEVRLKIEIPNGDKNLIPWTRAKFLTPDVADLLEDSDLADPENWFIYDGHVDKTCIRDVTSRALV